MDLHQQYLQWLQLLCQLIIHRTCTSTGSVIGWEFLWIILDNQSSKVVEISQIQAQNPLSWLKKKLRLVYSWCAVNNTINPAIPRGLRTLDARYLYAYLSAFVIYTHRMHDWHPTPRMHCKRMEIYKYERGIKVRQIQSRRFKDV